MIPNCQPVWAVFADGTRAPVIAFNPAGKALIVNDAGDLAVASKAPRFNHVTTKEN